MRWAQAMPPWKTPRGRQRGLPFLERQQRWDRLFKQSILLLTMLVCAALVLGTPVGRYAAQAFSVQMRTILRRWLGLPHDRAPIEALRDVQRRRDVESARVFCRRVFAEANPHLRRLLDHSGLGPEDVVLRSGNYNKTLLLSSKVFLPDTQRSYRMRPNTQACWVQRISLPEGLSGFFLLPETDELPSLVKATGAFLVPNSSQLTNSWGCRGPEPDPTAPLRGLILGDSNMQGIFIGENEAPPVRLCDDLETRLRTRLSILNTGHLGYSPEQMYHTLVEYAPRFQPHFVVFSFCPNDFGNVFGEDIDANDLDEGKYWVDRIHGYCRDRKILVMATPVPYEQQLTGRRREGDYPGRICNLLPIDGLFYCNPIEDFADEHLRLMMDPVNRGARSKGSPLFNGVLDDWHLSAAGARVWAMSVGSRLALLLEDARMRGELWFERSGAR